MTHRLTSYTDTFFFGLRGTRTVFLLVPVHIREVTSSSLAAPTPGRAFPARPVYHRPDRSVRPAAIAGVQGCQTFIEPVPLVGRLNKCCPDLTRHDMRTCRLGSVARPCPPGGVALFFAQS